MVKLLFFAARGGDECIMRVNINICKSRKSNSKSELSLHLNTTYLICVFEVYLPCNTFYE